MCNCTSWSYDGQGVLLPGVGQGQQVPIGEHVDTTIWIVWIKAVGVRVCNIKRFGGRGFVSIIVISTDTLFTVVVSTVVSAIFGSVMIIVSIYLKQNNP